MRNLGFRRIMIILALVFFNVSLASSIYLYLDPETENRQRELNEAKLKETQMREDIDKLVVEIANIAKQSIVFDTLKSDGFFTSQSRTDAKKIHLDALQQSGIISADFSVRPGAVWENEEANKSSHVLLISPIEISIKALDDIDVFKYIYLLEQSFPGYISTQDIVLSRNGTINDTTLRGIASGANPPIVEANIKLAWRTMVPKEDFAESTASETGPQ